MIELLKYKGLVMRQPDPSDCRARLVYLTKNGWARHTQLRKSSEEVRETLYGALQPEELVIVQMALDRIAEAFKESQ